jgi:pilus assembly protein CpaB
MSTRFRIVLSAAFALLGIVSCLAYADAVRSEAERVRSDAIERFGGEVAQLVVANQTLEAGEIVTERNVQIRDWLAELAPAGAVTSLDEVLGREVHVAVAEGSPLADLHFRDENALSEVPAGHVAVSVPVTDKLGISRGVSRGATLEAYAVEATGPRLIATDVEVLSEVGTTGALAATQQVTIAVLPDDVAEVLGASATGDLRLVMPASDVQGSEPSQEPPGPPDEIEVDAKAPAEGTEETDEGDAEGGEQ